MGLTWQQGPLAAGSIGRFIVPDPLPDMLPFAESLRRRMRVKFGGEWIADSEDVALLHATANRPRARHVARRGTLAWLPNALTGGVA